MDPGDGAPQGAVLSPLLSNIYLDPLDHLVARSGFAMVRYADDFVILCRTPEEASRALELVRTWVSDNGLTLHPTKTKVVDARTDGFDFLGYHFRGRQPLASGEEPERSSRTRSVPRRGGPTGPRCRRSSPSLNPIASGLVRLLPTQSTVDRSGGSTAGSAAGFGASCANGRNAAAWAAARITAAGPTPSSPTRGFSVWREPMRWPVNPL